MIYPPPLKVGDAVAMIAPSGVVDPQYTDQMCRMLERWGLHVLPGKHLFSEYGMFAGTAEERLSDLQQMLDHPEIKAIFCARGGYGAIHLLDRIVLDNFNKHPKWVVGYSDITVLHSLLSTAGYCSLHAPMSSHIAAEGEDDESVAALKKLLFGEKQEYHVPAHPLNRNGACRGKIRGGNLSLLHALRGTAFDLLLNDTILFVEDVDEKPYRIERMMYNLKLGKVLKRLKGLIVGKFSGYEEDPLMKMSVYDSIARLVSEYDYPVCFDFPVGHTKSNYPLVENGEVLLSVTNTGVRLKYL
ncbi:MAG: LD-carboxypeptidase [Dysgonamonadaceae bacterium]|jgi:muramoyltetrapeptide carboxypeptidase|nr:LD-carboxypeptidase [Dysgonamonadaceae bacterium]